MVDSIVIVRCANCGVESTNLRNDGGQRTPCSVCGSLALNISIEDQLELSESMEVAPAFSERDWVHRWEALQAQQIELSTAHGEFSVAWLDTLRHELHSFYTQTHHLKDALKIDAVELGLNPQDIENEINRRPALALAADLANQDKHRILDVKRHPPRSGHVPKVINASAITVSGGWRVKLIIEHDSKHLDGLDLASEIIREWRDVLIKLRLIP
jgi:hypothetical protein